MRGKVAKELRRHARKVATERGWKATQPEVINVHPKRYPWLVKFEPDGAGGQRCIDAGIRPVHQNLWSHFSERGHYLHMKRQYKKAAAR